MASVLASALGPDKSAELVADAMRALGHSGGSLSPEETRAVFAWLGKAPGVVGVIARVVVARGDVERLLSREPTVGATTVPPARPSSPVVGRRAAGATAAERGATMPGPSGAVAIEAVELLTPSLGGVQARLAVMDAQRRLGTTPGRAAPGVLAILEDILQQGGMLGVVAKAALKKRGSG